ncbi:MAG: hypothetical protein U0441_18910 [Polyangiaceae bacterium]
MTRTLHFFFAVAVDKPGEAKDLTPFEGARLEIGGAVQPQARADEVLVASTTA